MNTFDLTLGINVNLVKYLNKQPLRLLAKRKSLNTHLFIIEFDLIKDRNDEEDDNECDEGSSYASSLNDKQSVRSHDLPPVDPSSFSLNATE